MLIGLLKTRNIHLVEMSMVLTSDALQEPSYWQIQGLIGRHFLSFDSAAWLVMPIFGFLDVSFYLATDRTNWQCTQGA